MNRRDPPDQGDAFVEKLRAQLGKRLEKQKSKGIQPSPGEFTIIRPKRVPGQPDWREIVAQIQAERSKPPEPGPHPKVLIHELVRDHLAPLLKGHGFRKKGRRFWRQRRGLIEVVTVQSSEWNNAWEGRFCIELGLCPEKIQKRIGGVFAFDVLPPRVCVFTQRLTKNMERAKNHWWSVKPGTAVAPLGKEINQDFEQIAFPWFIARSDPKRIEVEVSARWPHLSRKSRKR